MVKHVQIKHKELIKHSQLVFKLKLIQPKKNYWLNYHLFRQREKMFYQIMVLIIKLRIIERI